MDLLSAFQQPVSDFGVMKRRKMKFSPFSRWFPSGEGRWEGGPADQQWWYKELIALCKPEGLQSHWLAFCCCAKNCLCRAVSKKTIPKQERCVSAQSLCHVWLCDLMGCLLPGSSDFGSKSDSGYSGWLTWDKSLMASTKPQGPQL